MLSPSTSILVLSLTGALALGTAACDRDRERRYSTPGETRTRSGELTPAEPSRVEAPRVDVPGADAGPTELRTEPAPKPPRTEPLRAEPDRTAPARTDAGVLERRFDAGRLSIVGSAQDRDVNLGIVTDAAAAPPAPAAAPPPAPAEPAPAPAPAPVPTVREGAGRPGAAGDPYQ